MRYLFDGQYSRAGDRLCEFCEPGKRVLLNVPWRPDDCVMQAGFYQPVSGQDNCTACPQGYVQDQAEAAYCLPCVPGEHQPPRVKKSAAMLPGMLRRVSPQHSYLRSVSQRLFPAKERVSVVLPVRPRPAPEPVGQPRLRRVSPRLHHRQARSVCVHWCPAGGGPAHVVELHA